MNSHLIAVIILAAGLARGAHAAEPLFGYRDVTIVRQVQGPKGDDGYRLISFGLFSYNDPSNPENIIHRLEINDVTDPDHIYGVSFGLCEGPERRTFELKPGGRTYVLRNGGCGYPLEFGRPGNEDQIKTTRDKLFVMRAQFAVDHGLYVSMGGSMFYVLYQAGTEYPGFVFFREDVMTQIEQRGATAGRPVFFVQTMDRDSSGDWFEKQGRLRIGEVDGRFFELVKNSPSEKWHIQEIP